MDENTLALDALRICLNEGISFFVGAFTSIAFVVASRSLK